MADSATADARGDSVVRRWDPAVYLRFAGERARPFADLMARVDAERPRDGG